MYTFGREHGESGYEFLVDLQSLERPFWFLWFAFVKVFKAVRGMNFIVVVMYQSQQRGRRGQRIVTSQSQEVAPCLLRFTLKRSSQLFFLAKEFDGFPLAFSRSPCRGRETTTA